MSIFQNLERGHCEHSVTHAQALGREQRIKCLQTTVAAAVYWHALTSVLQQILGVISKVRFSAVRQFCHCIFRQQVLQVVLLPRAHVWHSTSYSKAIGAPVYRSLSLSVSGAHTHLSLPLSLFSCLSAAILVALKHHRTLYLGCAEAAERSTRLEGSSPSTSWLKKGRTSHGNGF